MIFYFREMGPLSDRPFESPIVTVFLPRKHRGVLTTAAEVHFLATPANRFPALAVVNRRFRQWVSQFVRVYSLHREYDDSYLYYLEGGLQNIDTDIWALPSGLDAMKHGHYFITEGAAHGPCEELCRQLRLRGVEGIEEAQQSLSLSSQPHK